MVKRTDEKTFTLFAECIFPEDLRLSKIPDSYLTSSRVRIYDAEKRESIVDYQLSAKEYLRFLGIDAPKLDPNLPLLDIWDDKYYAQNERVEILFPELEKIITDLMNITVIQNQGRYEHHRFIALPNRWSQQSIAEFIEAVTDFSIFVTTSTSLIYGKVPESIAKNTGFPEEKLRKHDDNKGPPEYHALIRE